MLTLLCFLFFGSKSVGVIDLGLTIQTQFHHLLVRTPMFTLIHEWDLCVVLVGFGPFHHQLGFEVSPLSPTPPLWTVFDKTSLWYCQSCWFWCSPNRHGPFETRTHTCKNTLQDWCKTLTVHHTHTVPFMPYSVHIILAAVDIEGDLCRVALFVSVPLCLCLLLIKLYRSHAWCLSGFLIFEDLLLPNLFLLFNLFKLQLVFTPSTCQLGWQYHIILTSCAEFSRSAPSTLLRVLIWLQMDILTVTTGLCVVGWETSVQQSSTKPHCSPVGYTMKLMSLGK